MSKANYFRSLSQRKRRGVTVVALLGLFANVAVITELFTEWTVSRDEAYFLGACVSLLLILIYVWWPSLTRRTR